MIALASAGTATSQLIESEAVRRRGDNEVDQVREATAWIIETESSHRRAGDASGRLANIVSPYQVREVTALHLVGCMALPI